MWEIVTQISSGISLAAFIVAAIVAVLNNVLKKEEKLIELASEEDRAKLVQSALVQFTVDTTALTKEQKYNLAIAQIEAKSNKFRAAIKAGVYAGIVLAIFALATIAMNLITPVQPTGGVKPLKVISSYIDPCSEDLSLLKDIKHEKPTILYLDNFVLENRCSDKYEVSALYSEKNTILIGTVAGDLMIRRPAGDHYYSSLDSNDGMEHVLNGPYIAQYGENEGFPWYKLSPGEISGSQLDRLECTQKILKANDKVTDESRCEG